MGSLKKSRAGRLERTAALRNIFAEIDLHIATRPAGVVADDVLDAAAVAWTALRKWQGTAVQVCDVDRDERGLLATIYY